MRREYPIGFRMERATKRDGLRILRVINNTGKIIYCFRGVRVRRYRPGETEIVDFGRPLYLASRPLLCYDTGRELEVMMTAAHGAAGNFIKEMEQ